MIQEENNKNHPQINASPGKQIVKNNCSGMINDLET